VAPGEPTLRVREDVARFVDEQMRPADLALVLKPLDQLPRMRFTRDRAALRATITSFEGRKGDYAPRSAFEEEYIGRAPAAVQAARAQIVTVMLTELALQLGELGADRATVVLVSDGFPRVTVTRRQRIPDLQGVVRAASRYHFSVYTLSPSDVTAEAGTPGATLQWLAEQTGGRFTSSAGTFAPGLARLAADLETYYALTFQPSSSDGRFHQIELRARRPGLEVRARPGFWAPLSSELRALMSGAAPSAPVRSLRRSALIDAWIGIRAADDGQVKVNVSWVPSAIANASRGRPAPSRVELSARSGGRTMYEGALAPAVVEAAGPARFDAPPGTLELNMRVLAADGSLLDTDTRDLPVPDLTRSVEPMALPVELLRARSARQFRDILDNPDAPPTSARAFSRAERLVVRVPIWQGPGAPIPVSVRVVNRGGAPMRILEPLDGSGRGLRIFDLPLAWLAPGEYAIEILLPGQRGEIRDRVSFRVTG
jgi:VWFA-related protein